MQKAKCIEETGKRLSLNNDDIIRYICGIEEERENLEIIIQRQYQERKKIEAEIEKLTYKLCLINKSLSMRIKAKNNYDRTIEEIRNHYKQLVDSSNTLRNIVEKQQQELDGIMNKKIGTGAGGGEEIKMLYLKSEDRVTASDDCTCINELPTKDSIAQPDRFTPPPPLFAGSKTDAGAAEEKQSSGETFVFPEEQTSFSEEEADKNPPTTIQPVVAPSNGGNQDLPVVTASIVDDANRRESDEDEEIEVNTVNAENARTHTSIKSSDEIQSYQPSIDTDILGDVNSYTVSIKEDSFEKSGPLPELPKGEDHSTGLLIQRLKMGLNLEADGEVPRHQSKLNIPRPTK